MSWPTPRRAASNNRPSISTGDGAVSTGVVSRGSPFRTGSLDCALRYSRSEGHMKRILACLLLVATGALAQAPTKAIPQPPIKLWRLDCGRLDENKERPWAWQKVPTPTPCFLIGNGSRYLLWDTGLSRRAIGANHPVAKLERTITDQLTEIGVKPGQIEFIGISHYHGDHTGQATQFPKAKLLIGAGDLEALKSKTPPGGSAPTHIQPWIDGASTVEPLVDDRDVF